MMNQLFYEAILKEKEREVAKYVEYNRIKRLYRDSARSQPESTQKDKNVISSWLLMVAKRIKGVFEFNTKDCVKALKKTTK